MSTFDPAAMVHCWNCTEGKVREEIDNNQTLPKGAVIIDIREHPDLDSNSAYAETLTYGDPGYGYQYPTALWTIEYVCPVCKGEGVVPQQVKQAFDAQEAYINSFKEPWYAGVLGWIPALIVIFALFRMVAVFCAVRFTQLGDCASWLILLLLATGLYGLCESLPQILKKRHVTRFSKHYPNEYSMLYYWKDGRLLKRIDAFGVVVTGRQHAAY